MALCAGLLIGLGACTSDPNRLPPTIGGGVNTEVGGVNGVQVLNLMVITRDEQSGFLEGSLAGRSADVLTEVSGEVLDASNNPSGTPIEFTGGPLPVEAGGLTRLSETAPFMATGEMMPGLAMRLTLTFETAGAVTLDVPIADGNNVDYLDATPEQMTPPPTTSATPG